MMVRYVNYQWSTPVCITGVPPLHKDSILLRNAWQFLSAYKNDGKVTWSSVEDSSTAIFYYGLMTQPFQLILKNKKNK